MLSGVIQQSLHISRITLQYNLVFLCTQHRRVVWHLNEMPLGSDFLERASTAQQFNADFIKIPVLPEEKSSVILAFRCD